MQLVTPKPTSKRNISQTISSDRYNKLTLAEQQVLSMLDSFAPSTDADCWGCDYDTLMDMANVRPSITDTDVVNIIGRLQGFKMLDCCFARDGDKVEIWVSAWIYRSKLRHEINTQLIARRNGTTQAA